MKFHSEERHESERWEFCRVLLFQTDSRDSRSHYYKYFSLLRSENRHSDFAFFPVRIQVMERAGTLGELKETGYRSILVKDEMRANLICKLKRREKLFPGIVGYDETVVPQLINAILARHNLILLGLRGQAKSRIIRQFTNLLNDQIPIIAGSEVNDDPYHPISAHGRQTIELHQDSTPIAWVDRDARFVEKLATPDVTIA